MSDLTTETRLNRYFLSVLTGTALLATGCGGGGGGGGAPPDAPTEVIIGKPTVGTVEDTIAAVGTAEANERVELKPEAPGLVENIRVTEGKRVCKGELLFELNARKEAASVVQAESEEKLARANIARAQALAGTKAISQQEIEQLESQVAVKAAVKQVEQERLTEKRILAPFDGVLGPRLVSPGQYVNAGTPLGTLVDDTKIKVRFRIPERQLAMAKVGQTGRVKVSAYPDRIFTGVIDLINPEVDESTRTGEARLIVANEDGLLKPGMFARVELAAATRENALIVPESALLAALDHFSVFVVEKGVAKSKPVKPGVRMPGKAEIQEGLGADQEIVVSGTQKLVDGIKVVQAKSEGTKPEAVPTQK